MNTTPHSTPDNEAETDQTVGLGAFAHLRLLERRATTKPRIGRNKRLRDSVVRLGQDPFLSFADRDVSRLSMQNGVPVVRPQYLGFFGPFGALPLNWTEEIERWFAAGDFSFVSFCDIFTARFLELYFRAWSDAHAITQFDHATDDRFQTYILSLMGIGTPSYRNRDSIDDTIKLRLAPLAAGRVKSPVRLRQMIQLHFGDKVQVAIDEFIPSWLEFEPDAYSLLGQQGSALGQTTFLGSRTRSLGDKIRVRITVQNLHDYQEFLPGGRDHRHLRDIVFWYLGRVYEIDVALCLPKSEVPNAKLGETVQIGYMACLAPDTSDDGGFVEAAEFRLNPLDEPEPTGIAKAA